VIEGARTAFQVRTGQYSYYITTSGIRPVGSFNFQLDNIEEPLELE
jgi:hypothetical protein